MGAGEWIAVVAIVVQVILAGVAGLWVVTSIRSTTEKLGTSIDHLSENVGKLEAVIEKVDEKVDAHEVRIAVLETQNKKTEPE